jgi:hypothetical protein
VVRLTFQLARCGYTLRVTSQIENNLPNYISGYPTPNLRINLININIMKKKPVILRREAGQA